MKYLAVVAGHPPKFTPVRGVATLTVVMVLFFVMAMVAAYTNRNLIFEQRTSANSYRSAQALAAADAGVDWAVAMLSGGIIDQTCVGGAGATNDFRSRYFNLEFDGTYSNTTWPNALGVQTQPDPSCVMTDGGWSCSCPTGPQAVLQAVPDEAPTVFRVRFLKSLFREDDVKSPGVVRMEVRGCTSAIRGVTAANVNSANSCHLATGTVAVDGQVTVEVMLGLASALPVPPVAALTAGGSITQGGGSTLRAVNDDANTAVALYSGGAIGGTTELRGPAGTTTNVRLEGDADLQTLTATPGAFFQALFGMPLAIYRQQPGAIRIDCNGGCNSAALAPILAINPTRVIWVDGNLTIDDAAVLGTAMMPLMLVVSGTVDIAAPVTINGVIYSEGNVNWQAGAATGVVRGALVTAGNFSAAGDVAIAYDASIVRRVRQSYGSYVRVPGSWRIRL